MRAEYDTMESQSSRGIDVLALSMFTSSLRLTYVSLIRYKFNVYVESEHHDQG